MFRSVIYSFLILIGCVGVSFAQEQSPKLVVGIVVDQMSYEYLYRYQSKFSKGGFVRLMTKGANCRSTHYNYVPTYTGPGHASIYTGTTPANHGIVANDWYSRKYQKDINCVEGHGATSVGTNSSKGECSPSNLKVNTITDQLKLERNEAKVISVSIKDRGAILPGGHLSDGSFWFDSKEGKFISSSYFMNELPVWVKDFNQRAQPAHYLTQTWNTFFPIEQYIESEKDDSPYEHLLGSKTSPTFPYNLNEIVSEDNKYGIFTSTPFANTYLTDFAIEALKSQQLGKGTQSDMLCISYSSTDIIGHAFGPQSIELEDTYIRLDREIERLLKELDKQVGKNKYTLFLTADHAVVPVPQLLLDKKMAGGYVFMNDLLDDLKEKLKVKFGFDPIIKQDNLNVYLDRKNIATHQSDYDLICSFIQHEMRQWDGVKQVYTAKELQSGSGDKWFDMVQRGFNSKENGDVLCILESGFLAKSKDSKTARKGTSHGSPFAYDTHVPLLFFGHSIPKKEIVRTIQITDIAPTIAHILNISFAHVLSGDPIIEIFEK